MFEWDDSCVDFMDVIMGDVPLFPRYSPPMPLPPKSGRQRQRGRQRERERQTERGRAIERQTKKDREREKEGRQTDQEET